MRIFPFFRTLDITGNSAEAAQAAIVRPLKSPSTSSSPAGRRSSRSGSFAAPLAGRVHLAESRSAYTASDRLGAALKSQSVGSAAGGVGVREITNPHTLIKNGVSVCKGNESHRHECRPKAGCADHSNPHIRIFQTHEIPNPRKIICFCPCPCRCLFSLAPPINLVILSAAKNPRICCCLILLLSLLLLVLQNQPQPIGCPIHRALAMGGMYKLSPALLLLAHSSLLIAGSQNALALSPCTLHTVPRNSRCLRPNPAHQKTNNPNPINKIKLSQKWFLVMVNQVQLN
jgi:hypothetical protein